MVNKFRKVIAATVAGMMTFTLLSNVTYKEVRADVRGGEVSATYENGKLTIGNDYIGRTFSTTDNKLKTEKITNKRTSSGNTDFIPTIGSEEFKVRITKTTSTPIILPAISREGWTAEADSRQNASGPSDGPASNLIDGNINSIWHTNYGGGIGSQRYPYNVLFSLNGVKTFQSFSYTPRQQGEAVNGNIKGYELWATTSESKLTADSNQWTKIASGDFKYDGINPIYVNLANEVSANQLKFVAISSNNGQSFAGGAEFNIHAEKAPVVKNDREFATSNLDLNGEPVISSTTATINDVAKTGKKVTFNFKPYTFKGVEYTISENIVMYEGDHFMRKYLEISVPDAQKSNAIIDYIDLESMNVNESDATWTIPTNAGGIVEMDQFKANLGQPIYIQGMFFGSEFPLTDTQIADKVGYIRYYSGKSFEQLKNDNQLAKTEDGSAKYVTWQTVAGAARSTEKEVIQADFFEYISSIATPSEFRIQYNSWFDNMMRIDDANILESFIEIDRELNKVETRPLDSYVVDDGWNNYNNTSVVDAVRSGTTLNKTGFWEFNSKFPEGLTPSSELVKKFGSNFGVWVGPRGGYNFYGSIADILARSGKGSKAGGSIDSADREYVKNFGNMSVDWQNKYDVNYWKWDGFVDRAQYNTFPAVDGVPGYANRHMTGGYQHMYHVTDMWEAWIDLFEKVRENGKDINKLWISLTCYVNPSPWYLQWANSVWLQCTADQADAGSSSSKMDRQITYRDAAYYDFIKKHEFQFPLANIYNHDPVYGKEGTGMTKTTATDEQFKNYLYMLSTRGTAFWELYYSDSIMTDGKYEVTAEFLQWAEENYHMLKNSKMFGGNPNTGTTLGGNGSGTNNAYGFSCFDGTDGIISLRNPATTEKEITFTFDRTMGVSENSGTLKYHLEHSYNLTSGTNATGTLEYGKTYTLTLKPDEVRILRVSKGGDTTAPKYTRAYTDGNKTITVKFNEKVNGNLFEVSGASVSAIKKSADGITYNIVLTEAPNDNSAITITARDIKDLADNDLTNKAITVTHHRDSKVIESAATDITAKKQISDSTKSINSNNGFTVSAKVKTTSKGSIVAQANGYDLGIDNNGKAYFTLNGATAVSKEVVNNDVKHVITGVKENNGILKLYVDGVLAGSAYNKENRYFAVNAGATTIGSEGFTGNVGVSVFDIAYGYDAVKNIDNNVRKPLDTTGMTVSVPGTGEGNKDSIFDNDPTTFWTSTKADAGISKGNPYLAIDLNGSYIIDKVDYTKRFFNGPANMWKCTGNLRAYVLEISNDGGNTWTEVKAGETFKDESFTEKGNGGTTEITFAPVKATNIRISGTASYHWQAADVNKFMTVADLKIFGEKQVATNLAADKNVSGKWTGTNNDVTVNKDKPLTNAVNGNKTSNDYADFGSDFNAGSAYIQVDLGKVSDVEAINLYRYWSDSRIYKGTAIVLSETENFTNPVIVYNSDAENVHGLGAGTDSTYAETSSGKTIKLSEVKKARYVRLYMHGSNKGNTNHVVELEVIGIQDREPEVIINMSELISRIAILNEVDTTSSTKNSVIEFNKLIKEGNDVLATAKTQAEVDNMVTKLQNAENVLVARGNTNVLFDLIESYKSLNESDYTNESWTAYQTAIDVANAIVIDNSNSTQEDVDTAITALESAKNALVKVQVENVEININISEPVKVGENIELILSARNLIVDRIYEMEFNVEYDKEKVDFVKEVSADDSKYIVTAVNNDNSVKVVVATNGVAIINAEDIVKLNFKAKSAGEDVTFNVVNGKAADEDGKEYEIINSSTKISILEVQAPVEVDKTTLGFVINYAEAEKSKEEFKNVVPAVVKEFESALKEAKDILADKNATESQVDVATNRLINAIHMLGFIKGDKTQLTSLIAIINALDSHKYTTSTWEAVQDELEKANKVISDENAMEEEVATTYDKLKKAYDGLKLVADKSKLEELINKAESIDLSKYTKESVDKVNLQLGNVKAVLSNEEATQKEVDEAAKGLELALNSLETKQDNNANTGDDDNNGNTSNDNNNGNTSNGDNNSNISNGDNNNGGNDSKGDKSESGSNNENNAKDNKDLPKTGGTNAGYIAILGIGLVVLGYYVVYKRRVSSK